MHFPVSRWLAAATLTLSLFQCLLAREPLRVHPGNPHLLEFRGKPQVLVTNAEHYGSVVNAAFDYTPYLDVMKRDGMNLTRLFLAGFRHDNRVPANDPLAPTPAGFLQPWNRATSGSPALDGLGKWDFNDWNPAFFDRLNAFLQACSDRGVVAELSLFSTYYTDQEWRNSPFNPANNVQGFGPVSQYDSFRLLDSNLIGVKEAYIRKVVREVNPFDNLYFEIQNEPFWNEPGIKDAEEVAFHNRMLEVIREEESTLANRHLVAHNFPQQADALSDDFDIINEHYPGVVPGSTIKGTEILLRDHYTRNKILGTGEADTVTEPQARLESWMFLLGGGAIYNGLSFTSLLYTSDNEAGDSELGNAVRGSIRNAARYTRSLDQVSLRRNLAWVQSGLPPGSTLQAMANPGQQYAAYIHHGKTALANFQTVYDPIEETNHVATPVVNLPEGSWKAVWTRPSDLAVIATEEFTHAGGPRTLAPVTYQADVALRIDRTGDGDATPPPPPTSFQAVPAADGTIRLSWIPPDATDVATYRIYRSDVSGVEIALDQWIVEIPVLTHEFTDDDTPLETTSFYVVTAVDLNGNESMPADETSATAALQNVSFGGAPAAIPGRIQAEDFDKGGQDVAYNDLTPENEGGQYRETEGVDIGETTDEGGGYDVFSTSSGEWLEYTVNVAAAGVYRLDLRSSNALAGGEVYLEMNGNNVSGPISIPQAGAEGEWQTITVPEIVLTPGEQVMRLVVSQSPEDGTAGAINWLEFTPVPKTAPTANAGLDRIVTVAEDSGSAPVVLDGSGSVAGDAPISGYTWTRGDVVIATGINPEISLPLGEHVIRLTVIDGYGLTGSDEVIVRVNPAGFVNGSFEEGLTGWTATGNLAVVSTAPYVSTHGSKLVAFNNDQAAPNGILSQTFATIPGQVYQLSFDMGVIAYNNSQQSLQVQVTGASTLLSQTYVTTRLNGAIIRWESKSLQFTANSSSTTLSFRDLSTVSDSLDLTLDNVRVVHQITRTLTVSSTPDPGAAITVSPADKAGMGNGITNFTRTYQNLATVTLSAPPVNGTASFSRWQNNGVDLAHTPDVTVVMDADHMLTAIYVEGLPRITTQPANTAVAAGGTATFQVTATSTNPLAYQWRFNNANIVGENSPTLLINNVDSSKAGNYDVIVSTVVGSVTSSKAALSILNTAPFLNGSFEDGFDGWTRTGNLTIQSGSPYAATDGIRQVAFNSGQSVPNGVLSQTFGTIPGVIYQLNFDMGVLAFNNSQQRLQVQVTGNSSLVSQTFTTNRLNGAVVRWESKSILFTANSAAATLTFRDLSTTTDSLDLTLDKVRIIPQITRTLTVQSTPLAGATITVSPADNSSQGNGSTNFTRLYPNATTVNLTAPGTYGGMPFSKWRKNGVDLATTAAVSVVMDADHTLTAVYLEPPPVITRTLTVQSNPATGATITVSPADNSSQGNGITNFTRLYPNSTSVSLTAPATYSGLTFSKWQKNGVDMATTAAVNVVMDADHTLTAVYIDPPPVILRTLTVGSTPADGAGITVSPADNASQGNGTTGFTRLYPDTTTVSLTAPVGFGGMIFSRWMKNGADLATTPAISIVMDANHSLTAVYVEPPPVILRTLTVESTPAAGAGITVSPPDNAGLANGITGFTRTYLNTTSVNLTAPATHQGLTFSKWLENGADLATTAAVSVVMDADHTLTAVYVEGPPVITLHPGNAAVAAGENATFEVTATGPGALTYQWRLNGSGITGANGPTLVVADVQPVLAGTYDVVVSNAAGFVTSNPATLTIPSTASLLNGSFENGFDGWTRTGNMTIQSGPPYAATDGIRQVAFNSGQLAPNGVLSQTFGTTPGQIYQLIFDMGVIAYNDSQQRLQVELSGSSTLVTQTHVTNRVNGSVIRWETKTINFTANSISTTLTFRDLSTATDSLDLTLDNVRLVPRITRTLSVQSTPVTGMTISVSPAGNSGQGSGIPPLTRLYPNTTTVNLSAPVLFGGYRFSKWQENGVDLTTSASTSVVMDADHTLTAIYVEFTPALPSGLKIMPLGDSITYGFDGTNAGYRGPLYSLLAPDAPGFQFIGTQSLNPGSLPSSPVDQRNHQSLGGYNIQDIANNLDGLDTTRYLALGGSDKNPNGGYWLTGGNGTGRAPLYPDIIAMMIGTNDLGIQTGVESRLRNLVTKLTTLRPSTKLFVAKITPGTSSNTTINATINSYNSIVTTVVADFKAAGKNIYLVDLNTGFPSNGFSADGYHPNDTGFNWMALQWRDAILASYPAIDPNGPPVITGQPNAVETAAGGTATFTVAAAGKSPFTYQWRFKGTPVSGANSATLALNNVQPANAGNYDVIVSNEAGQVTSIPAALSVLSVATLVNGSFESALDGWTVTGNVQSRTNAAPYTATNGTKIAAFNTSNTTPNGTLSQSFTTSPGATYTLAFDVGVLAYNTLTQQIQVTCTGTSTVLTRNVTVIGPGNGTTRWTPQSFTFTANSSSTVLMFRDISTDTNALDLLLDNVRLTGSASIAAASPTPQSIGTAGPAAGATNAIVSPAPPDIGSASMSGTPGNFRISLSSPAAGSYILEKSTDLRNWERAGQSTSDGSQPVEFEDMSPPDTISGEPAKGVFYRIGRLPDTGIETLTR